ncbi:hypothetical protein, partial [Fusobacterium ulcerans]|uniref:hypothetical protein n=1 Tax=Fusobacterium ulcerans TaxID=861 RepID=UPI002EA04B44|nr:hypothetical protein [Fusobacterium ulcerans]
MGILTNFLKLLKPEPNDFVDVTKHISENYDKLDKNAETTNKTLTDLGNNKLDKGTYTKTAGDLKTEIDSKLDKGSYIGNAQSLNESINNLNELKLDNGGYTGNAQGLKDLSTSIWGGVYGGIIQEQGLKEVGKHYID